MIKSTVNPSSNQYKSKNADGVLALKSGTPREQVVKAIEDYSPLHVSSELTITNYDAKWDGGVLTLYFTVTERQTFHSDYDH
jgi:hypothetical protein